MMHACPMAVDINCRLRSHPDMSSSSKYTMGRISKLTWGREHPKLNNIHGKSPKLTWGEETTPQDDMGKTLPQAQ